MTLERPSNRGPSLTFVLLTVLIVVICCAARPASSGSQVFTGSTPSAMPISCAGAEAIRTATFKKQSAGTRLRITYKDTASAVGTKGGSVFILGRIDGHAITSPTGLRMAFGNVPAGTNFYSFGGSFTLVGYADGLAQGNHTLTFVYDTKSLLNGSFTCFRDTEPFLIEIDER